MRSDRRSEIIHWATAVARPEQPFQMIVDRPFFRATEDRRSGALLFVGAGYLRSGGLMADLIARARDWFGCHFSAPCYGWSQHAIKAVQERQE